jgi:mRNA-degrading endonuclease YafQ of YafQ-DinJ toxin-antitoxin module
MLIDFSDKMERDVKKLKDSIAKAILDKTIKAMSESQDGSINNMFEDHQLTGALGGL